MNLHIWNVPSDYSTGTDDGPGAHNNSRANDRLSANPRTSFASDGLAYEPHIHG